MRAIAKLTSILVVLLAGSALAQQPAQPPPGFKPPPMTEEMRKMLEERQKRQKELLERQKQAEDAKWPALQAAIVAPTAPSPWLEKERGFLLDLLTFAKPKLVVLPPVVPDGAMGIDISGRITMARQLARVLEAELGELPDPALAYRAAGEPRGASAEQLRQRLSRAGLGFGAQWLVVGTATHDGAGKMRVTFSKVPFDPAAPQPAAPQFDRADIPFSAERTPEMQFAPLAAEAARALGYKGVAPASARPSKAARLELAASPATLVSEEDTLGGLWMQQLIGVLHTPFEHVLPRPRERVFERTLAAALDAPADAPDRAVLLARALAYLDRRQAALQVLAAGEGSAEEKALAAYLNADLPALTAAIAQLKRPAARLISQLELVSLRWDAEALPQRDNEDLARSLANALPAGWRDVLTFHVLGFNLWTAPQSAAVKRAMDREFPVPGYATEDLVRDKIALGARSLDDKTSAELALSPLVHAQRWRAQSISELCCHTGSASWGRFGREQYLDLLEADAGSLAMARVTFLYRVQGLADEGRRLADLYDATLLAGGHPGLVQERILMGFRAHKGAPPEQAGRLANEVFENSRRLFTWETAQSEPLGIAWAGIGAFYFTFVRAQAPEIRYMRLLPPPALERDAPMRALWAERVGRSNRIQPELKEFEFQAARFACQETIGQLRGCLDYFDKLRDAHRDAEIDKEAAVLVEPRFRGFPRRYIFLASRKERAGEVEAARSLLQEATRLPGAPMLAYESLGRMLQREARFGEASKAYLSYPGLKTAKDNIVGLSIYAGDAGQGLARRGAWKDAKPLLQIAAANGDGSHASLKADAQLALSSGDLRRSLEIEQGTYQRYRMPDTAAAVASLHFVLGHPDQARGALKGLLQQAQNFSPYRAETVGLRIAGADAPALLEWNARSAREAGGGEPRFGNMLNDFHLVELFQVAGLDRDPVVLPSVLEYFFGSARPRMPGESGRSGPPGGSPGVGTRLMESHEAFLKGEHGKAVAHWEALLKEFDEIAFPPRMGGDTLPFWSMTPYYAFSLAKQGRADEARAMAQRLTKAGRPAGSPPTPADEDLMPSFDRRMIAAIVAALGGDEPRASKELKSALGVLAQAGARLVPPEYAFVELCEALTKETSVKAYRDLALAFARGYEDYEPWSGWAYAFDAQYSAPGPKRLRAAALALKFDPQSARLQKLDPGLLKQARQWLKTNDPFRPRERTKELKS